MGLSLAQQRSLAIVPHIAGSFSFMGSLFIIIDVVRDQSKLGRTYSRILLGMSCCDIITSFWYGLSTWPIPKDSGPVYAVGTQATCIAQGFFVQFGLSTPLYNACLAFYYLFIITWEWNESRVKQAEIFLHAFPLTIASSFAFAGIPLTLYNNANLWCWIASVPLSCATSGRSATSEVCERGNNAWIFRWAFFYAPLWFTIVVVTIVMTIITRYVYKREAGTRKFSIHKSFIFQSSDGIAQNKTRSKPLANQVFWQSLYYLLAFYLTWVFATCLRLLQTIGLAVPFPILLLMSIMTPLQGFLNFLVYLRPRVLKYREKHPELPWLTIFYNAIKRTTGRVISKVTISRADDNDADVLDPAFAMSRASRYSANEHNDMNRRDKQLENSASHSLYLNHTLSEVKEFNCETKPMEYNFDEHVCRFFDEYGEQDHNDNKVYINNNQEQLEERTDDDFKNKSINDHHDMTSLDKQVENTGSRSLDPKLTLSETKESNYETQPTEYNFNKGASRFHDEYNEQDCNDNIIYTNNNQERLQEESDDAVKDENNNKDMVVQAQDTIQIFKYPAESAQTLTQQQNKEPSTPTVADDAFVRKKRKKEFGTKRKLEEEIKQIKMMLVEKLKLEQEICAVKDAIVPAQNVEAQKTTRHVCTTSKVLTSN